MLKTSFAVASVVAFVILAGCGGGQAHQRSDWRHPRPCTTNDDCNGGTCALGDGQMQAECTGGALPPLPAESVDGGTRPPGPGPSIQPSPGDIQI